MFYAAVSCLLQKNPFVFLHTYLTSCFSLNFLNLFPSYFNLYRRQNMLDPGDFFVCMHITAIHNLNKFFGRISVIFIFIFLRQRCPVQTD